MSVERGKNKPRAYQRFLPGEFREAWGIENPEIVGIDPQKSQESIESLAPEEPPRFRGRLINRLKRNNIQTRANLLHLDLEHPPQGIGQRSITVIQKAQEELFLREKVPPKPPPEISLPQNLEFVLETMVHTGIFSSSLKDSIRVTEKRIKEMPGSFNIDLGSFFSYIAGRGYPLNLEDYEKGEEVSPPKEALPYVVRILYKDGIGHNILVTWGDPIYKEVQSYYQKQQQRLQKRTEQLGIKEKFNSILPFTWFWSDFYFYRGLWFWQGRPDEDQLDAMVLVEHPWWEKLSSALIFRLGAPPLVEEEKRGEEIKEAIEKRELITVEEEKDPLAVLNLSRRAYNSLRRAGISTPEEILAWDWSQPPRGIGKKSFQEIESAIGQPLKPKKEVIFKAPPPKPPPLEISPPFEKEVPIDRLNISKRVYNALRRVDIATIEDLRDWDWSNPPRRIGRKSLQEIKEAFSQPLRPKKEEIMTTKQLAEATQVPLGTVYKWAKEGLIGSQPAHWKRWRFTQEDLKKAREIKKELRERQRKEERRISPMGKLINLRKGLRRTKFPKKSLGLREAAKFLGEIGQELAIKPSGYPSHHTVEKLLKTAVILGDFPLSPEAIRVTSGGFWLFSLNKRNLLTIFDVNLDILKTRNLTLEEAWQQAKKTFQEEREKRIPIEYLLPEIFQQVGYSEKFPEFQKTRTKKFLIENLQQGKLPLRYDVKPQEILVLGVLPEDREDFVVAWAEFIKKEIAKAEKLTQAHIFENWPSLTRFLREQLGEEIKIDFRYLPYTVAWLKAEGILVTTIRRRQKRGYFASYHFLSPQARKRLNLFLKTPENREELERTLRKGFNLEEILAYQKHFPEDFHLSVTELYHLATGKRRWLNRYQQDFIIRVLKENNISLKREKIPRGVLLHKVSLSEVERAVAVLESSIPTEDWPTPPPKKTAILSTKQLAEAIQDSPYRILQLAHQGLIGHHPRPGTHWRFSQEDLKRVKELSGKEKEVRSNLMPLGDAVRKLGISREKLITLCQKRKTPLFSLSGRPILRDEVQEKGHYCLRKTDFEAILIGPLSTFDLVCLTGVSGRSIQRYAKEGLIGTKEGKRWVFTQEDLTRLKRIKS